MPIPHLLCFLEFEAYAKLPCAGRLSNQASTQSGPGWPRDFVSHGHNPTGGLGKVFGRLQPAPAYPTACLPAYPTTRRMPTNVSPSQGPLQRNPITLCRLAYRWMELIWAGLLQGGPTLALHLASPRGWDEGLCRFNVIEEWPLQRVLPIGWSIAAQTPPFPCSWVTSLTYDQPILTFSAGSAQFS